MISLVLGAGLVAQGTSLADPKATAPKKKPVVLRVAPQQISPGGTIRFHLRNRTHETIATSINYDIHRYDGGRWVLVYESPRKMKLGIVKARSNGVHGSFALDPNVQTGKYRVTKGYSEYRGTKPRGPSKPVFGLFRVG